jgi:Na+/H+ antiporter NhaD/arsenite permease-like protein
MKIIRLKFSPLPFLIMLTAVFSMALPKIALAEELHSLDLTHHGVGYAAIVIFCLAYIFVMAEEVTHLRKSKPVCLAAGTIWALVGTVYASHGMSEVAEDAVRQGILEYAELFLFLLVTMTVGKDSPRFILLACVNIVVGANAGGALSPFGDITTDGLATRHGLVQ